MVSLILTVPEPGQLVVASYSSG